jgi:hypothetical protein
VLSMSMPSRQRVLPDALMAVCLVRYGALDPDRAYPGSPRTRPVRGLPSRPVTSFLIDVGERAVFFRFLIHDRDSNCSIARLPSRTVSFSARFSARGLASWPCTPELGVRSGCCFIAVPAL